MQRLAILPFVMILLSLHSFLTVASTSDSPGFILKHVNQADVVGKEMFTYFFWDVYEATLYAPKGEWQPDNAFALSLRYQRALQGEKIAKRSIKEMRNQGMNGENDEKVLTEWLGKMTSLFPNVEAGDVLTGIAKADKSNAFYFNGEFIGSVKDSEFTERFFAIWLSENTSEPAFRKALLNQ